jgi:cyclic 2,3-diphosphoglycerate synthetase
MTEMARRDGRRLGVPVVALIDGEHHPPVVRASLERLARSERIAAVLFAGGEEKVADAVLEDPVAHYGHPVHVPEDGLHAALRALAGAGGAEAVVDLSGDPVLPAGERFALAATALDLGLEYRAPGMALTPPPLERIESPVPILAVIGTGKRTGKTALGTHFAMLLRDAGRNPVVVSMGRGGPPEPDLLRADDLPDLERLIEIVRGGGHAASDYQEDALLAQVTTVGCRRCGEGPAGEPFESNVAEGVAVALRQGPGVVVVEGSGAALPPVAADRTVCATSVPRVAADALSYLGPLRLLRSQLLVVFGAADLSAAERDALTADLARWMPRDSIALCELEPEPADELPPGAVVACFTTAGPGAERRQREALARRGVEPLLWSHNLARRRPLERDVADALGAGCDVFLTELKAAAVEVVAARAHEAGARVVFLRNRPVAVAGEPLDERLLRFADVGAPAR